MKKLMYIFFALPILTGCKEKKSAGAMGGMPTPEISVAKPIIKNVTLTKDYPGYLTTEKTVNLVARVNGNAAIDFVYCRRTGETRTIIVCHRTYLI